ncbi:unnamed protein product [Dovyalis caffra]|uniref:NAC domain-containing protein n=1 Tax=Dovyalis caffra TaxID=77055 RepID=A0AAV1R8E9_9ROSI|nr:unnamed protein product [Dovyalis caffra]
MRPNLLPGYRFCPSDQELIIHYLDKKVKNEAVVYTFAVNDFDLYSKHPWEIWDMFGGNNLVSEFDKDQGLFFFTQLRKRSGKDSRFCRSFGDGTWHGEDAGALIKTADTKLSIGLKKRFTYKNSKSPHGRKWIMYEFSLVGHSTDYVLCQLKKNDKDKKLSESETAIGLPEHKNKKRKSEASTRRKNPRSKKPKPSSSNALEFGVSKSHWANSELIAANPIIIELTGDDVADEICYLEESEKASTTENNVIISYAAKGELSGVHGFTDYRRLAPSPVLLPSTDCEDCEEQHGVDKLVGETQSQSEVGGVLSNLMHEIEETEIGSFEEFWSIPDDREVAGLIMELRRPI